MTLVTAFLEPEPVLVHYAATQQWRFPAGCRASTGESGVRAEVFRSRLRSAFAAIVLNRLEIILRLSEQADVALEHVAGSQRRRAYLECRIELRKELEEARRQLTGTPCNELRNLADAESGGFNAFTRRVMGTSRPFIQPSVGCVALTRRGQGVGKGNRAFCPAGPMSRVIGPPCWAQKRLAVSGRLIFHRHDSARRCWGTAL